MYSSVSGADQTHSGLSTAHADEKFREFTNGVDYLLRRIVDSTDPDVSKMRARLYIALTAAKDVMADGLMQARIVADTADHWVRKHPWQSIGLAACAGAIIGVYATRNRDSGDDLR
jgi:ElaB/YqjD/DUF883 family membrane-anchored ribosome-binding protein